MVDSGVVGLRKMSISMFVGFRIRSRSRRFFRPLHSCVMLNFVFVYLVYMCVAKVKEYSIGVVNNQNSNHIPYVKCYILSSRM
jgi:vacuolar-type H+-ATPase subunit I/STV1